MQLFVCASARSEALLSNWAPSSVGDGAECGSVGEKSWVVPRASLPSTVRTAIRDVKGLIMWFSKFFISITKIDYTDSLIEIEIYN